MEGMEKIQPTPSGEDFSEEDKEIVAKAMEKGIEFPYQLELPDGTTKGFPTEEERRKFIQENFQ